LRPVGNLGRLGYGLCLLVVLVAAPYVAHLYLNRDEPHVRNVDTPRSAKIAAIDPKQAAPDLVGGASQEDTAEQEAGGQRPAVDAEPETPRAGTGAEPETRRPRAEAKPETQPPAAEADARKSATSTVPRAGPSDDSGTPPESWLKQAERLAATEAAPEHRAAAWVALARAHHSLGDTAGCDEALQAAAEATKAVTDPYVGCRAMMSVVSAYERLGRFGESETLVSLLMARLEAMPSVAKGRPVPESYAPGEFKMMLLGQLAGIYSQAAARAPADSDLGQASTTLLARMEQVAAGLGTEGERYLGRLYRVAALVEQGRYGEALAEARPRDKPYSADHFMDGEYYGSLVEAMLAQGAVKAGDHLEYEKHRLAAEGMLAMAKGRSAEVRDRAQLALIEAATAAGETEQAQDKVGELRGPASRAHALLTVGAALAGAGQIDPAGEMLSEIHRDPRAEALAYELGRARRRAGEDPDGLNTWLQTLPPGAVRAAAMAGAAAAPRDHARQASEGNHG